jgi:hypothetical protein
MSFMMMLLLMAGVGALLGGLVAVAFGIPVKEFSFGNTLIVVGAMAACTGLIMVGLSVVVGELKLIARRLPTGNLAESRSREPFQADADADEDLVDEGDIGPSVTPLPPVLPRARQETSSPPEPTEPTSKLRRNLMFAATSRKERERQGRSPAMSPPDLVPPPVADVDEAQYPSSDNGWAKPSRPSDVPPFRRPGRPLFVEQNVGIATTSARNPDQQTVTILKSGVVDGMAYSLYSDGSIEAELPEGTMRFGSIDELRAHLDQRSG